MFQLLTPHTWILSWGALVAGGGTWTPITSYPKIQCQPCQPWCSFGGNMQPILFWTPIFQHRETKEVAQKMVRSSSFFLHQFLRYKTSKLPFYEYPAVSPFLDESNYHVSRSYVPWYPHYAWCMPIKYLLKTIISHDSLILSLQVPFIPSKIHSILSLYKRPFIHGSMVLCPKFYPLPFTIGLV